MGCSSASTPLSCASDDGWHTEGPCAKLARSPTLNSVMVNFSRETLVTILRWRLSSEMEKGQVNRGAAMGTLAEQCDFKSHEKRNCNY